jgi:septal ring factor EnvC (AmiA/AmiB activator)
MLRENVLPGLKVLLERMRATTPDERPTSAQHWDELGALHFRCFAEASSATVKRLLGLAEPSPPPTGGAAEVTAFQHEVAKLRRERDSTAAETAAVQKEIADLKRQRRSLRVQLETSRREIAALRGHGASIAAESEGRAGETGDVAYGTGE